MIASAFETVAIGVVPRTGTYRIATNLSLAEGPGTTGIRLFGEVASHFVIAPDDDGHLLLRLTRGSIDGAHDFASDYQVAIPSDVGLDIELFVDKGLVELSLGGGMFWFTNLFFPANLVGEVSIAEVADQSLEKARHG